MYLQAVENSVDPDQLASEQPADLDLQCFRNQVNLAQHDKGLILFCFKSKFCRLDF